MSRRANPSKEEGDRIAEMVLALVTELTRPPVVIYDKVAPEPTGITVSPEMRPYVEQRSDQREGAQGLQVQDADCASDQPKRLPVRPLDTGSPQVPYRNMEGVHKLSHRKAS